MVNSLYLAKANFLIAKKYKIDWYGAFFTPLLTILPVFLLFYFGEKSGLVQFFYGNTNTKNIFGYILIGAAYWNYIEVLWGVIFTLRHYMRIGQLEEIFLMPVNPFGYIFGWSVLGILKVTLESIPIIILSILFNLTTLNFMNFIASVGVFIISMLASFGFVFFFFGVTLLFKDGDELVSLVGNAAPLLGGMFFPITVLPIFLRIFSYLFPFSWGLDLMRHLLMNTNTILEVNLEYIILIIISTVYLIGGIITFKILEKKSRKKGLQGF
ncbi:MAG: ABC transporter [Marinitoga sp. 4572_148]|nr:MAG: ABC transporter [Marinitoga sp. 4572_148]